MASQFYPVLATGEDGRNELTDKGHTWRGMYLGAFLVLRIPNDDAARELTELTRSDEEAAYAIHVMHNAIDGDRVWPALVWLREQRGIRP